MPILLLIRRRRAVQVQRRVLLHLHGAAGRQPVAAHVAAQRLAHGELEPAHGALVLRRLPTSLTVRARRCGRQRVVPPRVARPVAPERLERREPPAARPALERAFGGTPDPDAR